MVNLLWKKYFAVHHGGPPPATLGHRESRLRCDLGARRRRAKHVPIENHGTLWHPMRGTEQWEYAVRGATRQRFPWGDEDPRPERARVSCHHWRTTYNLNELPLAEVNEQLGLSPFGLRHTAGNVWQWCRDSYDPQFYSMEAAVRENPVCRSPTEVRSDRGGSWIGPPDLARSSYRRGRPPLARGRCRSSTRCR